MLMVMSCQDQTQVTDTNVDSKNDTAQTKELEPTKPEETEVYEPKPPTVNIDPETGIPSDAIVLFDGSDFDQWISSVDSTEV